MFKSMSAHREKRARGDRGFTLIELLVVVVIIGILIAIAIPLYLNYRKGANDKAAQSDLRGAVSVLELCNSDTGTYPSTAITAATGNPAACTGQTINLSTGTTLTYAAVTGGASYSAVTTNSGGSKFYCYNSGSATAGGVKTLNPTPANLGAALTACQAL